MLRQIPIQFWRKLQIVEHRLNTKMPVIVEIDKLRVGNLYFQEGKIKN